MKIEFSDEFAEQVGAPTFEEFENKHFGNPGTYKRYSNDRKLLKDIIKDTFVSFLTYPLRWLPWGHIADTFWFFFLTEDSKYNAMDGMAFKYIGDAYVVGLRDGLRGKKHNWTVKFDPEVKQPYAISLQYPLWLLTKLVWPKFVAIYKTHKENRW